jgi:thiamine biosynthesis lipoprotein
MRPMRHFALAFRAMGSPCELQIYAPNDAQAQRALRLVQAEVERLEAKYSRYREMSILSRINHCAGGMPIEVDTETAALLNFAAQAHAQSGGLFDPTSGALRRLWDFRTGQCPEPAALEHLLPCIGWDKLNWNPPQIGLPAGMELDFGGFVKEYAADAALAILRQADFRHGLLNLGGDVAVLGPHPNGAPWQIGVRHPRRPEQAIAQIPLHQGGLASSGDYERFFVRNGQHYCHILNPKTGWPVQGYAAVSVVAPACLLAGVASTVAMLLAPAQASQWLEETGLAYLAIQANGEMDGRLSRP